MVAGHLEARRLYSDSASVGVAASKIKTNQSNSRQIRKPKEERKLSQDEVCLTNREQNLVSVCEVCRSQSSYYKQAACVFWCSIMFLHPSACVRVQLFVFAASRCSSAAAGSSPVFSHTCPYSRPPYVLPSALLLPTHSHRFLILA